MTLIYLAIGLVAGVLSGIFGIGGGVVIVPALILLARLPTLTAAGTSLGALLLPVGALGAWTYYKNSHLDVRAAALLAVGLAGGVFFGATFAQGVAPSMLKRGFAILLVGLAVRMWMTAASN